jgi:RIO1 family
VTSGGAVEDAPDAAGREPARVPAGRVTAPRRPQWPNGGSRRRPSGRDRDTDWSPPPGVLPAAVVALVSLALLVTAARRPEVLFELDRAVRDALDTRDGHPGVVEDLAALGPVVGYGVLWVPTVAVLVWTTRWRHAAVYLGTISLMAAVAQVADGDATLAREVRARVTGSVAGFDLPAWPVIVLSTVLVGTLSVLTPPGRARRWGWGVVVAVLAAFVAGRAALGLDAASLGVMSATFGAGAAAVAFALLAPADEFPVTYHRQVTAHLELDADRIGRVLVAVRDQLGVDMTALETYRLDGSAGSTPCRLQLAHGPPEHLFGKLYATSHLRSDRFYKLARVLRYGRLEDEAPFASVRRLVEHEDYMLRLLRDGGVRVPEPFGVVEVVPGREYLLVTELVPDAVELLEADVDDAVLDDALQQVRRLWAAGAAHRDIKPSNVLVQDRSVFLVDVSFGELRPSRWRQAADLAAMILSLALAVGPRRVVDRGTAFFTPDEMAEALAVIGPLTLPRALQRRLADQETDLVAGFRELLPEHPRIRVQRWSLRRVLLAVATVGGAVLAVALLVLNLRAGGLL